LASEEGTTIGKTLTLLIIFLVVVVAIVVIFAYFNGVFKFVSPSGGSMFASGVFAIVNGSENSGNLIIQVEDTSHVSITDVVLACPATQFASSDCGGLKIDLNGSPLSVQNPLRYGQTGSNSGLVDSPPGTTFTPGTAVDVTVTATFSDGSIVSTALILPAQFG
jgi:hypothetical protein